MCRNRRRCSQAWFCANRIGMIRKFWIRGPDQYKKNDRGRSVYVGRGQPITFVAWRHIGDDYVEYARATLNPTPTSRSASSPTSPATAGRAPSTTRRPVRGSTGTRRTARARPVPDEVARGALDPSRAGSYDLIVNVPGCRAGESERLARVAAVRAKEVNDGRER